MRPIPDGIADRGNVVVAGAARLARGRAMLGLRPRRPSRSLTLAPAVLNESDRLPTTCLPPASRWRASAVSGDDSNGRHDGSRFRALARTAAPATEPIPRQHRRRRRRRNRSRRCSQIAAERRALPMPACRCQCPFSPTRPSALPRTPLRLPSVTTTAPRGPGLRPKPRDRSSWIHRSRPISANDQRVSPVYRRIPAHCARNA